MDVVDVAVVKDKLGIHIANIRTSKGNHSLSYNI